MDLRNRLAISKNPGELFGLDEQILIIIIIFFNRLKYLHTEKLQRSWFRIEEFFG